MIQRRGSIGIAQISKIVSLLVLIKKGKGGGFIVFTDVFIMFVNRTKSHDSCKEPQIHNFYTYIFRINVSSVRVVD